MQVFDDRKSKFFLIEFFQPTDKASNPPKRTSSSSNMKFFHFFFLIFVFLDPDPENHFYQDFFTTTLNGLGHEIDSNIA
jgi:hypothetical protein